MINTDGIVPKQSFRGDIWPVYLAIADLETKSRGAVSNCLISSIICGFSKPTPAMWKIALEPLRLEKIQLEQNCITIKDQKFTFSIQHGIFDFEAGVSIYDGVGHSSLGKGCLNCFVDPQRCQLANSKGKIPNKRLWPIEGDFELFKFYPQFAKYFNELFPEELNQMKSHARIALIYE
uniref:Uncharacterized protein n=1 Tax=Panagrolaimus davidi TaxID=227884 RepID=A0A914PEH8_9BILA